MIFFLAWSLVLGQWRTSVWQVVLWVVGNWNLAGVSRVLVSEWWRMQDGWWVVVDVVRAVLWCVVCGRWLVMDGRL